MRYYVLIISFVALVLSGCASDFYKVNFRVVAVPDKWDDCSASESCNYAAELENTSTRILPEGVKIEMLVFDCDGNTLDSSNIYYDEILVGRKQREELRRRNNYSSPVVFYVKQDWPFLGIAGQAYVCGTECIPTYLSLEASYFATDCP